MADAHDEHSDDDVPDLAAVDAEVDDIKIEYHPHSKKLTTITPFHDFSRHSPPSEASDEPSPALGETPPWSPFRTRLDFEVASFALDAGLKEEHVNTLISLLECCSKGDDQLTLGSAEDIDRLWNLAAHRAPEVGLDVYTCVFKMLTSS